MKYRRIRLGQIGDNATVGFAVEELVRYLKLIDPKLMVEVLRTEGIVNDFSDTVWVGIDELIAPEVPEVPDAEQDDAIAVSVENGQGYITGSNDRSVLIAAYRFLKELGCDWVRPGRGGERIISKELDKISVYINEKADYRHRGVCIEGADSYENVADMIDYLPKVGMNEYFIQFIVPVVFFERWYVPKRNPYQEPIPISRNEVAAMVAGLEAEIAKRGIMYHKVGHGWTCEPLGIDGTGFGEIDTSRIDRNLFQYMAEVDGVRGVWKNKPLHTNLCYSDPKVREMMTDAIVRYCQENRHIDVLHFWLADGINNQCECENCRRMRPSDWYVMMLNELDAKLSLAGIDTKVAFLMYNDLLWAPESERLNNPNRFIMMFAPITRIFGQNYADNKDFSGEPAAYIRNKLQGPKTLGENLEHLRRWKNNCQTDSFIYDYHLMWAHVADPGYELCAKNLFEDMRCLDRLGLNGMVSCQVQRCAFPTALPLFMMASALWNKSCDFDSEAMRYYQSAFGKDGALVHRYLSKISELVHVYRSSASGHPVFNNSPMCDDYGAVTKAIDEIRPVTERNLDGILGNEWSKLLLHTEYVKLFVRCLELLENGDLPALKRAGLELGEFVNRNEPILQSEMDGFNTHRVLFLRLGLRKSVLNSIEQAD